MVWPKKLYLVDNNEFILYALRQLLRGRGFEVEFFDHAEKVVEACATNQPDVIVSDYHLPEVDGIDLLVLVAKRFPDVGRIIFTGGVFDERLTEAFQSGVVQVVIHKPWKLGLMLEGFEALRTGNVPIRIVWKGR